MALDVSVILPNNLRSGYLQSEFLNSGSAYTTNRFSPDPLLNSNKNQIVLGFELRDKETRDIAQLKRIKTLYLSNDPYFESSSTIKINNWPDETVEFNSEYNYYYNLNSNYFFNNSLSQGSIGVTESGTGLFKINNWPLSANGGLSRVYVKAVLEGPGNQEVEYPNGYGIFDTIYWEGEIPTSPQLLEFSTLKNGWVGKNTKINFNHSSSFLQGNNDGISSYILSKYEIYSTPDIFSSRDILTYRNILPNASVANTSSVPYKFYRESGTSYYSSFGLPIDEDITLGSTAFNRGVFYYSQSKILSSTNKPDFIAQAAFGFSAGSIGATSHVYIKLYDQPDYNAGSKELTLRLDIPNNSYPTSYLYTIDNNIESSNKQITSLPNSLLPLLKNGGILELAYSSIGTSYAIVESYFTPNKDQEQDSKKSYLLGNAIVSGFGSTYIGAAFGYDIDPVASETNTIKLQELALVNCKNDLSLDLGDCSGSNLNNISSPVVELISNWTVNQNIDYVILNDKVSNLTIINTVNSSYVEVNKIDDDNIYPIPSIYEIQLLKPSLSKSFSVDVKFTHKSDDFYIAVSSVSSYRPKTINGFRVEWDRAMGSRCLEDFALSNNPISAPTIIVKFSQNQNNIVVLQRNSDNSFSKQTIKTYSPSNTFDRYVVEISDVSPSNIKGTKNPTSTNGTWVYVKKSNGSNLDLIGFAHLRNKMPPADNGLGYYVACGFAKSPYDSTNGNTFNKVHEIILKPISNIDNSNTIKQVNLSLESISDDQLYMGQKLLSGDTNFESFAYSSPVSSSSIVEVSAVSEGNNYDLEELANSTIDGVSLNELDDDSYIILKDQIDESQNGLYKKITSGNFELQTSSFDVPYETISGNVNKYSTFYKIRTNKGNVLNDRFVSTSVMHQITIDQISPFISSINPSLFEFKMNYLNYEDPLDFDSIKIRFYSDSNNLPNYDAPLTDWLSISSAPLYESFTFQPNSNLVQVFLNESQKQNFSVSQSSKIWVQIILPFNVSLAKSSGSQFTEEYLLNGKFTYFKLAPNLWHKLFAFYTRKKLNDINNSYQYIRLRSQSHGKLQSHLTKLIGDVRVDISGPQYLGKKPLIENVSESTLRNIELNIFAEDDGSGIMSFRVGRDIDNFRVQYTPWMSWSQFTVANNGLYTIYLYGNLNYYNSGIANTSFDLQNMNYSGARKIWVQLMDYAGNISESYPLTFVTQSWNLVDTQPPIGSANFYNPKTFKSTKLTNSTEPLLYLSADDIVSGVKDFKYRKINDLGPDIWSEWNFMSNYKKMDFSNDKDGVKKIELVYRDYGNNATQPEIRWEIVERPKK